MKRDPRADYMARKAIAEAHYAKVLGGTIAEVAARNAAATAHLSAAEKRAWLDEKFILTGDGMRSVELSEQIKAQEKRLLGSY